MGDSKKSATYYWTVSFCSSVRQDFLTPVPKLHETPGCIGEKHMPLLSQAGPGSGRSPWDSRFIKNKLSPLPVMNGYSLFVRDRMSPGNSRTTLPAPSTSPHADVRQAGTLQQPHFTVTSGKL